MFVGIDVAKAELVVAIHPTQERWTVANDERGVRTLVERLRIGPPTLIVLEATGGYELLAVAALVAAALPVVVANPVRCATSRGARASWRRRTVWMPTSSPPLRIGYGPRCGPFRMRRHRISMPS